MVAAGWTPPTTGAGGEDGDGAVRDALAPLALLGDPEGAPVNMSDPLSKWFTFAQLRQAHFALAPKPGAAQAGGEASPPAEPPPVAGRAEDWRIGDKARRCYDHPLVKAGEVHDVTTLYRGGYLGFALPIGGQWNPSGWTKVSASGKPDAAGDRGGDAGLSAAVDRLLSLLDDADEVHRFGIPDCVDNTGAAYQSQAMFDTLKQLSAARNAARSAATASPAEVGLREALECAKIKLSRYRQYHPDTWVGGVEAEYQSTVRMIEAALAKPDAQASDGCE